MGTNYSSYNKKLGLKKSKSKNKFDNLKNDYFLIKVFDIVPKKKSLEIIKYNKNIKERINININDYKNASGIYSSIELEIIPTKIHIGTFIKIKKEEEKYYHIFFNRNKKEIKRTSFDGNEKVKKVTVIIDHKVKSLNVLFFYVDCVESVNFKRFYRNNITDMSYMFYGCSSLKKVIFSNFNTDNVTDMRQMFSKCTSLEELNLSKFNTSNVTNMSWMFFECSSLKELDLSNFNTNKVTDMSQMFSKCSSLKELNISNFNTTNETDMLGMFSGCSEGLIMKIKSQYENMKDESLFI